MCMTYYRQDPAHDYTGPGFAWQAALFMTKLHLDLFLDEDTRLFMEKGIRGGVSMISRRFAHANNKYIETYDPSKPTRTNLYGTVMLDPLPINDFKWVEPTLAVNVKF